MNVLLYLFSIVLANVLTAALVPFNIGAFIIPAGTFLIGATFILRDTVQIRFGRRKTYGIISAALLLSALTSYLLGDTLWIVFASAVSFALSEATDTEVFTRLKRSLAQRVLISGTVGGVLDSAVFVIVGLSPIGAGFLPWEAVPMAVLGQAIVKTVMQGLGALVVGVKKKK